MGAEVLVDIVLLRWCSTRLCRRRGISQPRRHSTLWKKGIPNRDKARSDLQPDVTTRSCGLPKKSGST